MQDLVGKTLGNYQIVEQIGRGGMAVVYKAYQPALERHVAIKVIREQLTGDDEQFLKRFQREARAVASLRHPNIVQVFDFGTAGDASYMVMEFLDGKSLKAELNRLAGQGETMPLEEVQRVFQAVASAVSYAHGEGMVHRDIKPANVMLTAKGEVILTDFGIARIVGAEKYTLTGAVIGTPAYLSPEQGKGERGDERSDIYALGVVLYEMVTGRVPFDADTPLAVIFKHISDPLPLPRQLNPNVPEALEQVILKATAKAPADRYATVDQMVDALTHAILPPQAAAVPPPPPEEAALPRQKPPVAGSRPTPGIRFSRRAWQGIALLLLLAALGWGACGLLFGAIPLEATETTPNPESVNFWITRGCFLGPAFAILFLSYLSFRAGRRRDRTVHCSEAVATMGVALGLLPILLGLALILQPASIDPEGDRVFSFLICLLPGLLVLGLSGIFWALVVRGKK